MRSFLPRHNISFFKVFFAAFLLFGFCEVVAQATYTTTGVTTGWNQTTTWSIGGTADGDGNGLPDANDFVIIASGHSVTLSSNSSCASIDYTSNSNPGSSISLNGFTLNVSGTITIPRGAAAGAQVNTMAVGSGILNTGNIAFTNGGGGQRHALTISTGTVTVAGNVTTDNAGASATITFTGAGILKVGGTFLTGTAGGTLVPSTGTIEYNGAAQTVRNFTYNNLTLSGSGAKTTTGATVNGILSMQGTATTAGTVATYGASASLEYKGSASQTTGIEFPATFSGTGGILINNANGVTLGGVRTIAAASNLTIGSSTPNSVFNDGGFQLTSTGTLNLTSGTFNLGSAGTATVFPSFGTTTISAGTTVGYIAGVAQTVSSTPSYSNLSLSGAGQKNPGGAAIDVSNNLTNSSVFDLNTKFLSVAGSITNSGTIKFSGVSNGLAISSGTVEYYGATQNVAGGTYATVNITTAGTKTAVGSITVTNIDNGGALNVASILNMSGNTLTATTVNNTNSTIRFSGDGLAVNTGTVEYYGGTQNVAGGTYATLNITAAGTKTASGSITATTIDNGGASNVAAILDMASNTLSAPAIDNTGATIRFSGASNGLAVNTGTIEYSGTTQTVTSGTYATLNISAAGTKTAGGNITVTTLLNNGGSSDAAAILDMAGNTLTSASIENTGATIRFSGASNGLAVNTGTIEYSGTTQTVTSGTYATLNISAAGTKTAGGNITVTTLLNNGGSSDAAAILDMAGNTLTSASIENTGATIRFSGASNGVAVSTGTVEYYGATQTVTTGTYATLNISAAGTKTAGGNITVTTLLDNGGSSNVAAILDMVGNTLTSPGIQNTGATIRFSGATNGLAVSTGTVEYYGSSQTVATGTYENLTINQSAGNASLSGDATLTGTLTFSGGKLNTGVNTFTMSSSAANIVGANAARFIVGNLQWTLPAGGSTRKFEIGATFYAPVTLVSTAVTGTVNVIATASQGAVPNENSPISNSSGIDQTKKVDHYWTISKSGAGTFTTNATFDFTSTANGGTPANYVIRRYESAPNYWMSVPGTVGGSTISTTGGLTSFGDFQVGERNASPTVSNPVSLVLCQGGPATLTVVPTGIPAVTYQWRKGGVNITGATAASLNINPVSISDAANYDCVVSNINGSATSNTASITVNPTPTLAGVIQPVPVCEGNTATITLTGLLASTTFTINYSINAIAQTPLTGIVSDASGVATFTTPVLSAVNNGQALGITGLTVTSATPNCSQSFSQSVSLVVNSNPVDKTISALASSVCSGSGTSILVALSAVGVNYQLRNNADNSLIGAAVAGTGGTISLVTGNLTLATTYNVLATTAATNCSVQMSLTPTVTINANPTAGLTSSDADNIICAGQSVTFTGSGGTNYEFFVDGTSVQNGAGTTYATTGLLNGQVVTVKVTNASGCSTTSTGITTTVNANPIASLVSNDSDNIICAGQSVTFTGAPTASNYNFRVNGLSVQNGALSTYTTTTLANGNTVDVIVTNASGCTGTSGVITMTVNPNPVAGLTSSDADNIICAGQSVTFTGSGGTNYEFFVDGTSVQNGAGTTYATTGLLNGQVVTVKVTNASGCSTTSTGITTTVNANPIASLVSNDSDNIICAGQSVTFTGAPTASNYNFRVNGLSVQNGALSTYTTTTLANGNTVDVIVTNASGCTGTSGVITMTVNPNPVAGLTSSDADNIICAGQSVTFTGSGGTNYEFFVDGTSVQNGAGTTYATTGLLNGQVVTVKVTNASGCSTTSTGITTTVNANPIASLVSNDSDNIICAGQSVTFTGAPSASNYNFRVNGLSVQNGALSTYTTTTLANGNTVDVIVTNASGCTGTSGVITMTVNPNPVAGLTSSDADNIICAGQSVTFTGSGGTNYEFFVDGTSVQNGAGTTYATTGLLNGQVVTVKVTNASGCSTTSTGITTTVNANPIASLVSNDSDNIICAGQSVTFTGAPSASNYNFRVNGLSVQNGALSTYTTTTLANGNTVDVIVTNASGCTGTSGVITMTVNPNPVAGLTSSDADNIICAGQSVTFTGSGGTNYEFFVDGTSVQNGAGTTYATTGLLNGQVVTVKVTNASGCSTTSTGITTTVNANPIASLVSNDSDNIICAGQSVTFTGAPTASNYNFRVNGLSVQNGALSTYTTTTLANGNTVDVIVTNASGCTGTSGVITMTVNPNPVAGLTSSDADNIICAGQSVTFTGSGGTNYEFFVDGTSVQNGAGTTYATTGLLNGQVVTVKVTNASGCSTTSTGITTTVNPIPVVDFINNISGICSGVTIGPIGLGASTGGGETFSWSGGVAIGLADGSDAIAPFEIPSFVSTNPGSTVLTATITLSALKNGCVSPNRTFTISINPIPDVLATPASQTICSGTTTNIVLSNPNGVSGTTYSWTLSATNVTGATSGGGNSILQYLTSTDGINSGTVTYTITPVSNGCSGTAIPVIITIDPSPTFSISNSTQSICTGDPVDITLNTPTANGIVTLINVNYNGANGTLVTPVNFTNGQKITEVLTNTTNSPVTVIYTFSVSANGCNNPTTQQTSVLVNPAPLMSITNATSEICSSSPVDILLNSPTANSVITLTNISYNGVVGTLTSPRTYTPGSIISETLLNSTNSPVTVVYSFTVAGNGCSSPTTYTTNVLVNPNPGLAVTNSTPTICSGTTPSISFVSPTANAQITLQSVSYGALLNGAYGSGATFSLSGILTEGNLVNNTNAPIVVTYTFNVSTPTNPICPLNVTAQSTTVTVSPAPSFTFTNSSPQICSGSQTNITLNTTVAGVQLRLKTVNYGAASGSLTAGALYSNGQVVSEVLTNPTNATVTVIYEFESIVSGCAPGASQQIFVEVKPIPVITNTALQLQRNICNGTALNFLPTSNTDPGTTYTWTSTTIGAFTGVTTNGSGSITDMPVNTANTIGYVTYSITPHLNSCAGVPVNYVVTVNPTPTASGSNLTICSGQSPLILIDAGPANVTGTTFNWTAVPSSNVTGASNDNGTTINQVLTLSDFSVGTVTYQVTPTANGCNGTVKNIIVTVNPIPTVNAGIDFQVCEPATIPVTGTIGGAATSGTWVIVSGAGSISSSTVSGTQITATYTVAPTDVTTTIVLRLDTDDPAGPCALVSDLLQVQINRRPTVTVPADYVVCEPSDLLATPINLSGTIGGSATTGNWSIISGAGSLSASTLTGSNVTSQYIIDPSDVGNIITLRLTTNDPDGVTGVCVREFKETNITINRAAVVSAGPDLKLCEDTPSIVLQGSKSGASTTVNWIGGSGVFSNAAILQPTYTFNNPSEINTSVTLTITASDPDGAGPCQSVSDQMILKINLLPGVVFSGLPPGTPAQMVENNPAITLTGNNVGGLFTISPTTSVIGSTTVNVVDRVTFDPSAVELGANFITYTFTDANGCTNSNTQEAFINPVTNVDFSVEGAKVNGSDFELCANLGNVKLIGDPIVANGFPPETKFTTEGTNAAGLVIINVGADYFIKTDGVVSDTYRIRYTFKNEFGGITFKERSIKIFASPVASFAYTNNCIVDDVVFTSTSGVNPTPFPTSITYWEWDFGDGSSKSGPLPNDVQSKRYGAAGTYNVTLKVTTGVGQSCSTTSAPFVLRVGDLPEVDFEWSAICNNDNTNFLDKTTKVLGANPPGISVITSYTWDFGDGDLLPAGIGTIPANTHGGRTFGDYSNPQHDYATNGTYSAKLRVDTNDGCDNSKTKSVFILPYATVAPVAGSEYLEDFEADDGGWISEAFSASNPTPPNSWIWGLPIDSIRAATGGTKVWWTGNNLNTYFANENSVVDGPCFNLTQLNRPMVAVDYYSDSQDNVDGAVLQYSVDGGLNWEIVGPPAGQLNRDEGINWFNGVGISSNPGSQLFGNYGWTGRQKNLKNARFNLDMIDPTKRAQVRLRLAFSSNDGNPKHFNGFAFDNFFVGEKKRNVLVEHFTTYTLNASVNADTYLNTLLANQITANRDVSDFNDIQYHVNFAGLDSLNTNNPTDPAARALYYGVSQPPYTIMDGLLIPGKFTGITTELNKVEIDRRALTDAQFELRLDTIATNNSNTISVQLTLIANQPVSVPLIAHVALLEDDVPVNGGIFKNVLRKQLFGSDGETINVPFVKGQTLVKLRSDVEIDVPVKKSSKLMLFGFVQDKNSKEIYQSIVVKAPIKRGTLIVGVKDNDPIAIANLKSIQLYPNPANGQFNFGITGDIQSDTRWEIIDQRGVSVLKSDFSKVANGLLSVDVSSLTNAVYYVVINGPGGVIVRKKLVVMNKN